MNTIHDIPFFILSAGEGKRMKMGGKNLPKSLIPISEKLPGSLELNIRALNNLKVKHIAVALGAYYGEITEMLVGINHLPIEVFIIDAVKNYKKGPLYSFLSGKEFFLKEELFGLIPGDTVFHPKIFDSLSQIKIESDICYLFYYVGKKEPSAHDVILITDENNRVMRVEFYSEIMKYKEISTEDNNDYKILIPLLLLNTGFFLYAQIGTENKENLKTKVIEMLIPYIRTTKRFRAIEISGAKRYYVDLDTPDDFEKVKQLLS